MPSLQVRDHLILQPTKWQWAVNWLKSKMTESSSYWSPGSDSVMMMVVVVMMMVGVVMMRIMMNMNLFKICSHRFFFICYFFRCSAMRRAVQEPSIGPHPLR